MEKEPAKRRKEYLDGFSEQITKNNDIIKRLQPFIESLKTLNEENKARIVELNEKAEQQSNRIKTLEIEKKMLLEQNHDKSQTIKRLIAENIINLTIEKAFTQIDKANLKKNSNSIKLEDLFLNNSKERFLLNATKEKKPHGISFEKITTFPRNKSILSCIKSSHLKSNVKNRVIHKEENNKSIVEEEIQKEHRTSMTPEFNKNDSCNDRVEEKRNEKAKQGNTFEIKTSKDPLNNFSFGFHENTQLSKNNTSFRVFRSLRIMVPVKIQQHSEISKIKGFFDHVFMNQFNWQVSIAKVLDEMLKLSLNNFFICIGARHSGKTFTFQGTKEAPGILPYMLMKLDSTSLYNVQVFDVNDGQIEDLLFIYNEKIKSLKIDINSNFTTLRVKGIKQLKRIFKLIYKDKKSQMNRFRKTQFIKITDISQQRNYIFVDAAGYDQVDWSHFRFLQYICHNKLITKTDKLTKILSELWETKTHTNINVITHLKDISNKQEVGLLKTFMETHLKEDNFNLL